VPANSSPEGSDLSPGVRNIVRISWAAFLAACFGDMVFFAFIDPSFLEVSGIPSGRFAAYSVGFLFFWGLGAIAAATVVLLVQGDRVK
jgi:hypothetical protein